MKRSFARRLYDALYPPPAAPDFEPAPAAASLSPAPARWAWHDGEKYAGGYGVTNLLALDYWTLRARSVEAFRTNLYARGILRRLVRNIINTGLYLEATPEHDVLGLDEDVLADWSELVENRFQLWEHSPELCDYRGRMSFGQLQFQAKLTALIAGDVLVVLHQDPTTELPLVRLESGGSVQQPLASDLKLAPGHKLCHGVELDAQGRHVAYWVVRHDADLRQRHERITAADAMGRKKAWLVYGTDKLLDDVRGEPFLAIMLQSLKEIDRYRDAAQRKAALNAALAMFIKKTVNGVGTRPITGGAAVRGTAATLGSSGTGTPRTFNFTEMLPGTVIDELAVGEEPQGFMPTGTDEKFSDFEAAIVYAISWAYEIPPEILTLSFNSNYSASQAALNEFKIFLNSVRMDWGNDFCRPVYIDWLLSEALTGRVQAQGLLDSWRDRKRYDVFAAWTSADWCGAIKPSVDLVKMATAYTALCEQGFISRDRASRETTGTKFSKNVKKLTRENAALAESRKVLVELENPKPPAQPPGSAEPDDDDESENRESRGRLQLVEATP